MSRMNSGIIAKNVKIAIDRRMYNSEQFGIILNNYPQIHLGLPNN